MFTRCEARGPVDAVMEVPENADTDLPCDPAVIKGFTSTHHKGTSTSLFTVDTS